MKKILLALMILLSGAGAVFCDPFEDALKDAREEDALARYHLGMIYVRPGQWGDSRFKTGLCLVEFDGSTGTRKDK